MQNVWALASIWVGLSRLATDSRYRFGDRIKFRLVHVHYLLQSNQSTIAGARPFLQ